MSRKLRWQLSRQPLQPVRRYRASEAPTRWRAPVVVFAIAHLDAPGHQGQAAVAAVDGVPVHFALKALRFMRAATRFAAYRADDGVGDATDAAPSRAGPRLNVGPNYVRPATGQRRITTRVMRPFTPRGRGVHTLPFQAHPRVASRPKSPARALATLFGLPATLRAGT